MNRDHALALEKRALHDWLGILGAAAPESRLIDAEGVRGAIVPACPTRSIPNSVSYTDADALRAGLREVSAAFRDAGIQAWTVWVPDFDAESIELLTAAGHSFDGSPTAMTLDLSEYEPRDDPGLEWSDTGDAADLGRINDLAYGLPADSGMAAGLVAPGPQLTIYDARVGGEVASVLGTADHGSDLGVYFVATDPAYRGARLAGRLLRVALAAGLQRGLRTASLQSSQRGKRVYEALGFVEHFQLHLYEKREL
jgi:ribosomal protein S18 acetylase RimI-like enzyme